MRKSSPPPFQNVTGVPVRVQPFQCFANKRNNHTHSFGITNLKYYCYANKISQFLFPTIGYYSYWLRFTFPFQYRKAVRSVSQSRNTDGLKQIFQNAVLSILRFHTPQDGSECLLMVIIVLNNGCRTGGKPSSEPIMTHTCVTKPQWAWLVKPRIRQASACTVRLQPISAIVDNKLGTCKVSFDESWGINTLGDFTPTPRIWINYCYNIKAVLPGMGFGIHMRVKRHFYTESLRTVSQLRFFEKKKISRA